jgi:hypothetical protein
VAEGFHQTGNNAPVRKTAVGDREGDSCQELNYGIDIRVLAEKIKDGDL